MSVSQAKVTKDRIYLNKKKKMKMKITEEEEEEKGGRRWRCF